MKCFIEVRWDSQRRSLENCGAQMQTSFNVRLGISMCVSHIVLFLGGFVKYFLT